MANVQFGTTYQDNNKKPIGDNRVISAGIYGKDEVVADVTYIDGVRVGETVLNRTRVQDPVNQVVSRGTQTIDDYFASTGGRFIWPADGGEGHFMAKLQKAADAEASPLGGRWPKTG